MEPQSVSQKKLGEGFRWNVPNTLSLYRIVMFPVLCLLIGLSYRGVFVVLLCINLVTDILDGVLARALKQTTEFGAKLDSVADITTMIAAVVGLFVFEAPFMSAHRVAFGWMLGLYALGQVLCLIKFKRFPSFHLYSFRVTGYVQGFFLASYFTIGYVAWYFYFMIGVASIAYIEELVLVLWLPELRSNLRSAYHVWRGRSTSST